MGDNNLVKEQSACARHFTRVITHKRYQDEPVILAKANDRSSSFDEAKKDGSNGKYQEDAV